MDKIQLANLLNGREIRKEITKEEQISAQANGLVVVFGASDDLMELRGAIYDEVSCYDGGTAYFDKDGLLENDCESDECPHFNKLKKTAKTIEAKWCKGSFAWEYETEIPHEVFEIFEEGEKYCKGIVFNLKDLA